jgi:endo-1,4-beta-D-glucanase Y
MEKDYKAMWEELKKSFKDAENRMSDTLLNKSISSVGMDGFIVHKATLDLVQDYLVIMDNIENPKDEEQVNF